MSIVRARFIIISLFKRKWRTSRPLRPPRDQWFPAYIRSKQNADGEELCLVSFWKLYTLLSECAVSNAGLLRPITFHRGCPSSRDYLKLRPFFSDECERTTSWRLWNLRTCCHASGSMLAYSSLVHCLVGGHCVAGLWRSANRLPWWASWGFEQSEHLGRIGMPGQYCSLPGRTPQQNTLGSEKWVAFRISSRNLFSVGNSNENGRMPLRCEITTGIRGGNDAQIKGYIPTFCKMFR